jgi:NADH/NAD ratio-sensing transcriptional regulator Rex
MSKGETNQSEIARILQVDRSTICRDVDYLRQQAKENITRYVDERLPEEYERCLVGLNSILKEAWTDVSNDDNNKGLTSTYSNHLLANNNSSTAR